MDGVEKKKKKKTRKIREGRHKIDAHKVSRSEIGKTASWDWPYECDLRNLCVFFPQVAPKWGAPKKACSADTLSDQR